MPQGWSLWCRIYPNPASRFSRGRRPRFGERLLNGTQSTRAKERGPQQRGFSAKPLKTHLMVKRDRQRSTTSQLTCACHSGLRRLGSVKVYFGDCKRFPSALSPSNSGRKRSASAWGYSGGQACRFCIPAWGISIAPWLRCCQIVRSLNPAVLSENIRRIIAIESRRSLTKSPLSPDFRCLPGQWTDCPAVEADVRHWHLADILLAEPNVRF